MFQVTVNGSEVLSTAEESAAWERFDVERARSRFDADAGSFLAPVSILEDGKELAKWEAPEEWDREELAPSVLDFLEGKRSSGDVHVLEEGWNEDREELESGGGLSFRSLGNLPKGSTLRELALQGKLLALIPPACSGSDYNGGALARSNVRALEELAESEGLVHWSLSGGHGSHGIAFPLWERSRELVSILEGLEDYPVVDEDAMSEEESEDEEQAWDSWVRHDFAKALETETGVDVSEVPDAKLRELFHSLCSERGRYFEHSDEGPTIDVDELAEGVERFDLLGLEGAVSTTADEEARAERILGAFGVKIADHGGDKLPALQEWERIELELRPLGVFDRSSDPCASVVSVLRQVADWPVPSELPILKEDAELADALEGFAKRLREPHSAMVVAVDLEALARAFRDGTGYRRSSTPLGAFRELRETVERVKSAARESVLPMLERSGRYGSEELGKQWGRDPRSGLLVLEHRRRELGEAWAAYCRGRDPKRGKFRTFVLSTEVQDKLLALDLSAADAVRSHVLDRIAEELRSRMGSGSGRGVLGPKGHGWEDVLEVDRASGLVRTAPRDSHGASAERKLEDFEHLLHV